MADGPFLPDHAAILRHIAESKIGTPDDMLGAADEIERLRAAGDALVAFATHERGCFLPGLEQCWCGKSVAAARWQEARRG